MFPAKVWNKNIWYEIVYMRIELNKGKLSEYSTMFKEHWQV